MLALFFVVIASTAEPRPLNDAERAAVAIAASFLSRGAEAVYENLSPDAPLRAIAREDALREIAVRSGPSKGATWTLQTIDGSPDDVAFRVTYPSGYDDGLLFRMKKAGDRWTLHELLSTAEHPAPPRPPAPPPPPPTTPLRFPLLVAAAALALFGMVVRRKRTIAIVALVLSGAAFAAAFWPREPARPARVLQFVELRELLPLREQLARGDEASVPASVSADARNVGLLWLLASGVAVEVPGRTQDPIAGLGRAARSQLADVVRARIALTENRPDEALALYERAASTKPLRDDVLVEAATSFRGSRAASFLTDRFRGSRDAAWYYARAASTEDRESAHIALLAAWALSPKPREELVRDAHLFAIVREPAIAEVVGLFGDAEPARRSPMLAKTPLAWPSGSRTFAMGELLRVELGDAALEVPFGVSFAPPDAAVVPATHRTEHDFAVALRDAKTLLQLPARATSPAARHRVVRAAQALARHNRWADLLKLTDDIRPDSASVPPDLLVLRMQALLRADRIEDARGLAEGDAVTTLGRRHAPAALLAIADAMASTREWKTAESLFLAVGSREHVELVRARLRQLERRRDLASSLQTLATAHFDIRYDPAINPAIASRIGDLLEAELVRLQQILPPVRFRRVTVNVLHWDDFRGNITGSDHILGLYDGEILFPFAVVQQFRPDVVSIITHELTHALLAQATADNAPRWFQEGSAQRMELLPSHPNPFARTAADQVIPVPLLDAVMENAADPYATEHGYHVSHAFIRFLEARYGRRAIATLAAEFAKGKSTADALAALTSGKSVDALNQEFRTWGFANTAAFVNEERFPYGHLYSPDIDPRIREGFRWGKKP